MRYTGSTITHADTWLCVYILWHWLVSFPDPITNGIALFPDPITNGIVLFPNMSQCHSGTWITDAIFCCLKDYENLLLWGNGECWIWCLHRCRLARFMMYVVARRVSQVKCTHVLHVDDIQ